MERFVTLVVGGGLAFVAGLWTVTLTAAWTPFWFTGVALAAVGLAVLVAGIRRPLMGRREPSQTQER